MSTGNQTEQMPIWQAVGSGGQCLDLEQLRGEGHAEDLGQQRPLSRTESHSLGAKGKESGHGLSQGFDLREKQGHKRK